MTEAASHNCSFPGAGGNPVTVSLLLPAAAGVPAPLAVFVHGFKGFKDWGAWPWMAGRWADRGLAALTVNLSHNGVADSEQDFTRLDLFQADTWGKRCTDLAAVLDWLHSGSFPAGKRVDVDRLGLVGHSMGGGLALLVGADDPRVRALVTIAGISTVHRFEPAQLEQMERDGFASFVNARTKQEMRVGRGLLDEIRADPERFDVLAATGRFAGRSLLVIQGDADPAVSLEDAHAIHAAGGRRATLRVFAGAGHTLGSKHPPDPAADPAEPFPRVADEIAEFLLHEL